MRDDEDFLAIRSMLGKSTTLRGFGRLTEFDSPQAIGGAPDAIRMQRVVSFYEKLPRGAAPEVKAKGLLGRYQAKHFGKNPTGKRTDNPFSTGCDSWILTMILL